MKEKQIEVKDMSEGTNEWKKEKLYLEMDILGLVKKTQRQSRTIQKARKELIYCRNMIKEQKKQIIRLRSLPEKEVLK